MRLIYLSPVSWSSFSQRPHKFVEWFHRRHGGDVMWVDPYPTRLPRLEDLGRRTSIDRPAANVAKSPFPHWLRRFTPRALPLEPIPATSWINRALWGSLFRALMNFDVDNDCLIVVGKPSALALQVLRRHPNSLAIYDAMDDFSCFYEGLSKLSMIRKERELARRAHWISVSSTMLATRLARHSDKLLFVGNACDADLPQPCYERGKHKGTTPRHVLGYVGTIGSWFDWKLVDQLARSNPEYVVRLIGPLYNPPPRPLSENVELLPACTHADAVLHMQSFSAGLIPFKLNALTASVDPIKYYEYRALGLPVLSTRFGEMSLRSDALGVFLLDASLDLSHIVELALAHTDDDRAIKQFRRKNSWEARFETAYGEIERPAPCD